MTEKWKNCTTVFSGDVFSLKSGTVSLDNNSEATRDVIEHRGGVVILPILDGKIVCIKQYRIALEKEIFELPAGRIQTKDSIDNIARSELEEETGYKANTLNHLLSYYPVPGITDLKIHIYEASDLILCGRNLEWDEKIDVVTFSVDEVREMLSRGIIEDGSAIIAINHYLSRLV